MRYKQGSIETAIKDLFLDFLQESLSGLSEPKGLSQISGQRMSSISRIKSKKGRVKDPNKDRRLKQNRGKQEAA